MRRLHATRIARSRQGAKEAAGRGRGATRILLALARLPRRRRRRARRRRQTKIALGARRARCSTPARRCASASGGGDDAGGKISGASSGTGVAAPPSAAAANLARRFSRDTPPLSMFAPPPDEASRPASSPDPLEAADTSRRGFRARQPGRDAADWTTRRTISPARGSLSSPRRPLVRLPRLGPRPRRVLPQSSHRASERSPARPPHFVRPRLWLKIDVSTRDPRRRRRRRRRVVRSPRRRRLLHQRGEHALRGECVPWASERVPSLSATFAAAHRRAMSRSAASGAARRPSRLVHSAARRSVADASATCRHPARASSSAGLSASRLHRAHHGLLAIRHRAPPPSRAPPRREASQRCASRNRARRVFLRRRAEAKAPAPRAPTRRRRRALLRRRRLRAMRRATARTSSSMCAPMISPRGVITTIASGCVRISACVANARAIAATRRRAAARTRRARDSHGANRR